MTGTDPPTGGADFVAALFGRTATGQRRPATGTGWWSAFWSALIGRAQVAIDAAPAAAPLPVAASPAASPAAGSMPDDLLTVDQLADRTGVSVRTIRFYSGKGLLPAPRRRGRTALYDSTHQANLQLIGELSARGFTLGAIGVLLDPVSREQDELLQQFARQLAQQPSQPIQLPVIPSEEPEDVEQAYRDR